MFAWTTFGKVKFKDEVYDHDIFIDTDMNAHTRRCVGDHHSITATELKETLTKDCEVLIVGTGQQGVAQLTKDTQNVLDEFSVDVYPMPTPEAIKRYNETCTQKKTIAIIHVTC